jgi:cleavage and polyadenylation specificity factor subunit 2
MTSIIRMTPISGGGGEEGQGPHCYLLNVDGFHILLDCGWDSKFSMKHMQVYTKLSAMFLQITEL